MFKKDLSRFYKQKSICPFYYNLVSFQWKGHIFRDTVLSMGLRSAAQICQMLIKAMVCTLLCMCMVIPNYLDDVARVKKKEHPEFSSHTN